MAVPRVYVRRGTTVWSVTDSLTHIRLTHTGRTNIDFFIPLHNRPLKGQQAPSCTLLYWMSVQSILYANREHTKRSAPKTKNLQI